MARRELTWSDSALFKAGGQVEVQLGYVNALHPLFKGEITGLEPEFCADDVPTLTVRGYDLRHRLMRGQHTRSFQNVALSDIAAQVAQAAGLTPNVTNTRVKLDYVLQHNQSDLVFLQERAREIGYEVVVDDKTLYFRPPKLGAQPTLTLSREADLIEFWPRLTTLAQASEVAVQGWDVKQKAPIASQAKAGEEAVNMGDVSGPTAARSAFGASTLTTVTRPVASKDEADALAKGMLANMALAYVSGEGVCVGTTDLRAGTVVKIEGLGKRFSGDYYVTSTTHSYRPSQGYRTGFAVQRNAT